MAGLSPECAPKRTSADHSEFMGSRPRHTVSTRLVVNGIHPHTKDQILGHAVDDMSRNYTDVPRKELIKAIDTLPVFPEWAAAKWMKDPVGEEAKRTLPLTPEKKAKLPKVKAA
jgi:integrase/recombinase XerD